MEKILVTGCSGLLGSRLLNVFSKENKVYGVSKDASSGKDLFKLDLTDKEKTLSIINKIKPSAVIHAAALTNVDYCEDHREEAWASNVEATANVAEACSSVGAKMLYTSTDFVFDGMRGMYSEDDEVRPLSYYAQTKLAGERKATELCTNHCICRTSVLYGWDKRKLNYVTWVINKLRAGEKINIVTDQYNTPTLAENLAEILHALLQKDASGVYHTCGIERISRYEFALKIADAFSLDKNFINPLTSDKLRQKAARPMDSSLDTRKLQNLGVKPFNILEGLNYMKGQDEGFDFGGW